MVISPGSRLFSIIELQSQHQFGDCWHVREILIPSDSDDLVNNLKRFRRV